MRVAVRVLFPDRQRQENLKTWYLTTNHAMSSYGLPVLVDKKNQAYGPADLPAGTILRMPAVYAEGARKAGYTVED